jgi:hypothetical protein
MPVVNFLPKKVASFSDVSTVKYDNSKTVYVIIFVTCIAVAPEEQDGHFQACQTGQPSGLEPRPEGVQQI